MQRLKVPTSTLSLKVIPLEGEEDESSKDQGTSSCAADDKVSVVDGTGHLTLTSPWMGSH